MRPAHALVGHRLEALAPGAHERIFRDYEEGVREDEQPGEDEKQRFHSRAELPSILALLLRDGSSSFMQRRRER